MNNKIDKSQVQNIEAAFRFTLQEEKKHSEKRVSDLVSHYMAPTVHEMKDMVKSESEAFYSKSKEMSDT